MDQPPSAPPPAPASPVPLPPGQPPATPARARSTWFRDLLEVLLIALLLYAVIWSCIETVRVDGTSMEATLNDGDFLIASKISYVFGNPQRGDIVILDPPHECSSSTADYVKRVIGLPGDNIEIVTDPAPSRVLVQPGGTGLWDVIEEPYVLGPWMVNEPSPYGVDAVDHVLHIPAGEYFVMGDNRNGSCDSRYFGLVPRNHILAKAILRIWPFSSFGGLGAGPTLVPTASPAAASSAGPTAYLPSLTGGLALTGFSRRRRRRIRRELAALAVGGTPG